RMEKRSNDRPATVAIEIVRTETFEPRTENREPRTPEPEEPEPEEPEEPVEPEEPEEPAYFTQVTSDQIFGQFTFSIETGLRSVCARNAGRSRSDLKPMWIVAGEISRSNRDRIGCGLRK